MRNFRYDDLFTAATPREVRHLHLCFLEKYLGYFKTGIRPGKIKVRGPVRRCIRFDDCSRRFQQTIFVSEFASAGNRYQLKGRIANAPGFVNIPVLASRWK